MNDVVSHADQNHDVTISHYPDVECWLNLRANISDLFFKLRSGFHVRPSCLCISIAHSRTTVANHGGHCLEGPWFIGIPPCAMLPLRVDFVLVSHPYTRFSPLNLVYTLQQQSSRILVWSLSIDKPRRCLLLVLEIPGPGGRSWLWAARRLGGQMTILLTTHDQLKPLYILTKNSARG